jgi:hypothetical protein
MVLSAVGVVPDVEPSGQSSPARLALVYTAFSIGI